MAALRLNEDEKAVHAKLSCQRHWLSSQTLPEPARAAEASVLALIVWLLKYGNSIFREQQNLPFPDGRRKKALTLKTSWPMSLVLERNLKTRNLRRDLKKGWCFTFCICSTFNKKCLHYKISRSPSSLQAPDSFLLSRITWYSSSAFPRTISKTRSGGEVTTRFLHRTREANVAEQGQTPSEETRSLNSPPAT